MKPLKGWLMPPDEIAASLPMLDWAVAEADSSPQRHAALRRFRHLLEADLEVMTSRGRSRDAA